MYRWKTSRASGLGKVVHPCNPAQWKLRHEDHEFEATELYWETLSKKNDTMASHYNLSTASVIMEAHIDMQLQNQKVI
jgi:hypothetical protein